MNSTPAISNDVPIGKRIKGAEMPSFMPSAHLPKFVLHRHDHFHELRQVMGTSKSIILVPLFYLTFLGRICLEWCRNVK